MTEHSKSRTQAEAAFLKTQTQSLSRNRIMSEVESLNQARDANTARLKEQRLRKEALERADAAAAPPGSKTRKNPE
jgi:hypothetical protein